MYWARTLYVKNRIPLNALQEGVGDVAVFHYSSFVIIAHEQNQSNRVC